MFNAVFKNKKVIITGNTGFKGAWLSVWLHQLGAEVFGLSKDIPTSPSMFETLGLPQKIKHTYLNICDGEKVKEFFKAVQPDFVFHLAAQPIVSTSYDNPVDTYMSNVIGTANILEALRMLDNSCNAVMITSDKCYDNVEWEWGYRENDALGGKDPYSASKGAAEIVIKSYFFSFFNQSSGKIQIAPVRAGNVIGGGDWAHNRIVPDCVKAWSELKPVTIRSPHSTRPWQHVLEPLSGYLRTAQKMVEEPQSINGEAFNFGPNADQNFTVQELLQTISQFWDFRQLDNVFNIEQNNRFHEAGLLKLNCDKALFHLGWRPVLDFRQTARFTGSWYNQYYNAENTDMYAYTVAQIDEFTAQAKQKELSWVR